MDNWRELVSACNDEELANALIGAIDELLIKDRYLLDVDASEWSIAAELFFNLKSRAPLADDGRPWDIQMEYNRNGRRPKTIYGGGHRVRPDIIFHRRGTPNNFLVIELKKGSSASVDTDDAKVLTEYRLSNGLNYRYALFLRLGVGEDAGKVTCLAWLRPVRLRRRS